MSNIEIFTEEQLDEEMLGLITEYEKALSLLENEYKMLSSRQDKFPHKFVATIDFEDFVILASQCKHKSISLMKNSMAISGRIESDMDYIESLIRMHLADLFLKDKFDRVTDVLRESYIKSNKNIKKLKKLKKEIISFPDVSEKLVRAFEGDEVNCRKFLDMKNKLRGLQ